MSIHPRLNPLNAALLLALGAPPAQAATFAVDSCDATALINAIDTANGNGQADVINLNGDCNYTLTAINNGIDGNNGLPSITSTITINGNEATIERSSAPGMPDFRLMHIAESGDLTLGNIIIKNGVAIDSPYYFYSASGGGLFNRGTVTLTNSTLIDNSADFGGGLYTRYPIGKATLANSAVTDNSASRDGGGFLNLDGTVTLTNSTLTGNSAAERGGGFHNFGTTVTLTNSTLSSNSARDGGGFYNLDSAISINALVKLDNSSLANNSAVEEGGGFVNAATVTLTNSTLTDNSADLASGGFQNFASGTVTLTNSTLTGNSAYFSGGGFSNFSYGTVTLTNSTLTGNSAGNGGGFSNFPYGTVTLTNSTLTGNSADNGGGFVNAFGSTVTLTNSTLSDNSAYFGGGFGNYSYSTVTLTNSTLTDNSAYFSGGGFENFASGTVTLTNSTLSSNSATNYGGGFRNFNNLDLPAEVTVTNSTLFGNVAAKGGGLYSEGSSVGVVTRLTNTLVSDSIGGNCAGESLVTDISNLFDDPTCNGITTATINLDPNLADNGGATLTHALLPGSTAIDAGVDCAGPTVFGIDQRGFVRDAFCDIGAYEFNALEIDAKIGVQRGRQWFLDRNGNGQWDGCAVDGCFVFGAPGDRPVAGDWNGDGFTEIGVLRNGQWFLDNGNGQWDGCGAFPLQDTCLTFGAPGDKPVAGDWDGDGIADIGVQRGSHWFLDNGNGQWDGCGALPLQDACLTFGSPGDQPVAGDWNNDGFAAIGVKRGSDWFLDNGNGQWDGCGTLPAQDGCISGFGIPTDQPVAGDWNGDSFAGIGVKRIRDWFLDRNANDFWDGCNTDSCVFGWGTPEDVPISGRWR